MLSWVRIDELCLSAHAHSGGRYYLSRGNHGDDVSYLMAFEESVTVNGRSHLNATILGSRRCRVDDDEGRRHAIGFLKSEAEKHHAARV